MTDETSKRRGRPKIHKDPQARVKAWRAGQKKEGSRLDGYINDSASWRLRRLAKVWGCSLAGAVERLVIESDEKYHDILFPGFDSDEPFFKETLPETKTADQDE